MRCLRYGATGAFIRVLIAFPPGSMPSDMRYGPNGNLYVCLYGGNGVYELHPNTGATLGAWNMPVVGDRPNDIAFLPSGEILVTCGSVTASSPQARMNASVSLMRSARSR